MVIDSAPRRAFVQIKPAKTAASAKAILRALHKACPIKITRLLTDNGQEFTDRSFAKTAQRLNGNR